MKIQLRIKNILFLLIIVLSSLNQVIAQNNITPKKELKWIDFKFDIGTLNPFNSTNPSVLKSNSLTYDFSIRAIGFGKDATSVNSLGLEFIQSKLINNDKTLGQNDEYNLVGVYIKPEYGLKLNNSLRISYNLGYGRMVLSRPWFVIPANLSANGKQIEEYPQQTNNGVFLTGLSLVMRLSINISIAANCEYFGATFDFEKIVHTEDKYITKVYNPTFTLRAYYISFGAEIGF